MTDKQGKQIETSYSEAGFWQKLQNRARQAGRNTVEVALKLYYAAQDPATPGWARTTVYSALGYFILPIDAIPDFSPFLGYADDLGVLLAASATIAACINEEHKAKARATLTRWFD